MKRRQWLTMTGTASLGLAALLAACASAPVRGTGDLGVVITPRWCSRATACLPMCSVAMEASPV